MTSVADNLPGVSIQEGDAYGFDDWSSNVAVRGFQVTISEGADRYDHRRVSERDVRRCFRHQLLLPRPYLVLTKPLRLDIQCQRGASVKIGWKYLDD